MSDTPNTQAVLQAADGRWTYSIKHFCESMELRIKELENERDTALDDLEFRRGLFQVQEQQLNEVRAERDEWKAKHIQQNKDLGCEMMDPSGTIWDFASGLQRENVQLKREVERERALANEAIATWKKTREERDEALEALAAWKEARSERR